MKSEEEKRLKQLEEENLRLKRLVANQALDAFWSWIASVLDRATGEMEPCCVSKESWSTSRVSIVSGKRLDSKYRRNAGNIVLRDSESMRVPFNRRSD